jgi:hypothetical protein
MPGSRVELVELVLPDFGLPTVEPVIPPAIYEARIQQRRTFMQEVLGIRLKPEVLPFSNLPAYLPPFWLSPQRAMRMA